MKLCLLALVLSLCPYFAFTQENRWFLNFAATYGKTIASQDIETSDVTGYYFDPEHVVIYTGNMYKPQQFSAQFLVGRTIKNSLKLSAGFRVNRQLEKAFFYCHICDLAYTGPAHLQLNFIEVPLRFQWDFIEKKSFRTHFIAETYGLKSLDFGRPFGFGLATGLGAELMLSETISLDLNFLMDYKETRILTTMSFLKWQTQVSVNNYF